MVILWEDNVGNEPGTSKSVVLRGGSDDVGGSRRVAHACMMPSPNAPHIAQNSLKSRKLGGMPTHREAIAPQVGTRRTDLHERWVRALASFPLVLCVGA
jgi:hypothetical protein